MGGAEPVLVGTLRPSFSAGRNLAASSFEYAPTYLARKDSYAISPDLPLGSGRIYTAENQNLFGAFTDSSPDEWGKRIVDSSHAARAKGDPGVARIPGDFGYLLGVSDRARMGALRFRRGHDQGWLSDDPGVANLHELSRILAVTKRYEANEATADDIEYLADVGTSPGGARPKVNVVTDGGRLALAKLPHSNDGSIDVEAWEAVVSTIAANAGLRTSPFTLHRQSADNAVLVFDRFDRDVSGGRIGYMSAATALGIGTHDTGLTITYENFADTIAELVEDPERELSEMYGRIALTVLVNNADDHWRNHGFLRGTRGWRLSPMFDVNPQPRRGVISSRAVNLNDDPRNRDIRNLLDSSDTFALTPVDASDIIRRVAAQVETWPVVATLHGIPENRHTIMAAAFDEDQIHRAKKMRANG